MNLSVDFLYQKLGQITIRTYFLIGLFIFCLPAFMANIRHTQDWGDDYALYLAQAEALLHGNSNVENGYIYQEFAMKMGPEAYPPGFPILLSIPLAFFGYQVAGILAFIALIACIWFIAICKLFQDKISLASLAAVILFTFYNGEFLLLKGEILSEIPFATLSFFGLFFAEKALNTKKWTDIFPAVICIAFAILTRSIGWLLIPAIMVQAIRLLKDRKVFAPALCVTVSVIILYFFISKILLPTPSETGYTGQFAFISTKSVQHNATVYPLLWGIALTGSELLVNRGLYLLSFLVVFAAFFKWIKQPSVFDVYFLAYLAFIIFWPHSEIRFLVPIFPLYLFYLFWGFERLFLSLKKTQFLAYNSIICILFIFAFRTQIQFPKHAQEIWDGPFSEEAQDMFQYIKQDTPTHEGAMFVKPRLLAWETKRQTILADGTKSNAENELKMQEYNIKHVLLFKKGFPYQEPIENLVYNNPHFSLIKENDVFQLYKMDDLK